MNQYEATYILNTQGKDEGAKEIIEDIEKAIVSLGGKVSGVQRLDRRRFERVAGKLDSGYYVILSCSLDPGKVKTLQDMFRLDDRIYRQHIFRSKVKKASSSVKSQEAPVGA